MREIEDLEPWYKQFWPWFLMSLPGSVVVACMITIYIAITTSDGLVDDDYYKEGLAYNRIVASDQKAASIGRSGELLINPDNSSFEIRLQGEQLDDKVMVKFAYATLDDFDMEIIVSHIGNGIYRGNYTKLIEGKWLIKIQPEDKDWRIRGILQYPSQLTIPLDPGVIKTAKFLTNKQS